MLDLLVKRVEPEELGRDGHRLVILLPPEPREGEEDGIHALGRERELRGMVNGDLDGRTSIHVHARTSTHTNHAQAHKYTHTHTSYTNHRRLDIDSQKSRQPTRHRQPEIEQPLTEKGFD